MSVRMLATYGSSAILLLAAGWLTDGLPAQAVLPGPVASSLAFIDATIVDVRTGQLHPRSIVIVADNRITAAGPALSVRIPTGARLLDAGGKYVIPGLMDTHVHFLSEWPTPPVETSTYFGWILAGGVTSVREMSKDGSERAIALRAEASAGRLLAPRIYVSAGPNPELRDPLFALFQRAGTRDIGATIRRVRASGVDGLKLHNFPRDTMLAFIATARAAGMPIYGHTVFSSPDRPPMYSNFTIDAVRAGLDGVVHALGTIKPIGVDDRASPAVPRTTAEGRRTWRLYNLTSWKRTNESDTQALIDAMVARRVWYEPTRLADYYWNHQDLYDMAALSPHHPYRSRDRSIGDAEMRAAVQESEAAEARFIRRFYEAGGMILAGTDEVPFPPFGVSEEMRLLVDAGLPPLAALQAATINAARAMRWDDRLGTVEMGKLADFVLLDANPLEDITNVRRIHAVVADGRLFDRSALDGFLSRAGAPLTRAYSRVKTVPGMIPFSRTSRAPASSEGSGLENRKPCATRQFRSRSFCACSSVSTPSAMTSMPSTPPRLMSASTMRRLRVTSLEATNERSILIVS